MNTDLNLFFSFPSLSSSILKFCTYSPCCDPAQQIPVTEPVFLIVYYSRGYNPTLLLPPTFFLGILCPFIPTPPSFSSQSNIFFKSATCPVCFLLESFVSSQLTLMNVPPSSPPCCFLPHPRQTSLGDHVSLPFSLPASDCSLSLISLCSRRSPPKNQK